jgi:3-dehydroquinate synthase
MRKALNFGHTIGHALESLSFSENRRPLMHGEAIAAGMVCAAWLSETQSGLDARHNEEISGFIMRMFPPVEFAEEEISLILEFIGSDKKNIRGEARFSLISAPGKPVVNCSCPSGLIFRSLQKYRSLKVWR